MKLRLDESLPKDLRRRRDRLVVAMRMRPPYPVSIDEAHGPASVFRMLEEVHRSIERGRAELAMARSLAESGGYSGAAFHCHQAAEMLLKGLWIHRKRSAAPRFHDLVHLGVELQASEAVHAALRRLNPEYVVSRYPDAANGIPAQNYDRARAEELVRLAESVERWISDALA